MLAVTYQSDKCRRHLEQRGFDTTVVRRTIEWHEPRSAVVESEWWCRLAGIWSLGRTG